MEKREIQRSVDFLEESKAKKRSNSIKDNQKEAQSMLVGNDDNATNEATHKITIRKRNSSREDI